MAIKTVSLKVAAYERLKAARRSAGGSFSEVTLRAMWPEDTITGEDLLLPFRNEGAHFSAAELTQIEAAKGQDEPPEDKWATR